MECGNKMGGGGGGGVGPINLPELVCESLRGSDSQAAVRGHLHQACTEELLSGSPPAPPSTETAIRNSTSG